MTQRRAKALKSPVKRKVEDASSMLQQALSEHLEVQLVLEVARRAHELGVTQIPVDFEGAPTTTPATASIGQYPFAAA